MGEEMIFVSFALRNPWWTREFNIVKVKNFILAKHKNIEIGLYKTNTLIGCSLSVHPRRDHGGFSFDVDILGFMFKFDFYDSRHWNYETEAYNEDY